MRRTRRGLPMARRHPPRVRVRRLLPVDQAPNPIANSNGRAPLTGRAAVAVPEAPDQASGRPTRRQGARPDAARRSLRSRRLQENTVSARSLRSLVDRSIEYRFASLASLALQPIQMREARFARLRPPRFARLPRSLRSLAPGSRLAPLGLLAPASLASPALLQLCFSFASLASPASLRSLRLRLARSAAKRASPARER